MGMDDLKDIFSRPLFTIIFRPKMIFLLTDSIFMVKTMIYLQPYGMSKVFT